LRAPRTEKGRAGSAAAARDSRIRAAKLAAKFLAKIRAWKVGKRFQANRRAARIVCARIRHAWHIHVAPPDDGDAET
jgi:hypothetical protein